MVVMLSFGLIDRAYIKGEDNEIGMLELDNEL